MEKDYQKTLELIFSYGYECCAFQHNICGDQPKVLDGMLDSSNSLPPEFFMNPMCLSAQAFAEATATEAEQSKAAKEL